MSIVSETGSGVSGAEMYGTIAEIDAYWQARPQDPRAITWGAANVASKEGAARESTAWIDAHFGRRFVGYRKSYTQGLEWPRLAGYDSCHEGIPLTDTRGLELPALPPQLVAAVAELAPMALSGTLSVDTNMGGSVVAIKRDKVGDSETEFAEGTSQSALLYTHLGKLLGALIGGDASWYWR